MIKFNETEMLNNIQGALQLRNEINEIIDKEFSNIKNICFMGIGGTYASGLQAFFHMKEKTSLEVFVENAASYNTTGNKRITKNTFIVISSVTGTTKEMVLAIKKAKSEGAIILGFIDKGETPLSDLCTYVISYPLNEQLKFFMVSDRIMHLNLEIDYYYDLYDQLDKCFAKNLIDIEKESDNFGKIFAEKHCNDNIHYFVASGAAWGMAYSYAMCYWEEQHWLRARVIESNEFFHGLLEVIEKNTPVTIYITEDSQRILSERVANFIPRICSNYTIIDSKKYKFPGLDEKYRSYVSMFILQAVNRRIDAHIEKINCHPMEIRRYYRQLKY